jgi:hypothetical protein
LPYAKAADVALQDYVFASREELWERVSAAAQRAEESMEKRYNQSHVDRRFAIGDIVLVRLQREDSENGNFNLSPVFDPAPWMITHVLSEVSVVIQCCDNKTKTKEVHVKDLQFAVEEVDPRSSDDEESVIEKLNKHKRCNGKLFYQVQWRGQRNKAQYTWEPRDALLKHAADLLTKYDALLNVRAAD